ncbi:MAG TPA: TonB-dependent receptor [Opitutus sp.]|nr:TonB-dependent receptor [Opitutus sp.]
MGRVAPGRIFPAVVALLCTAAGFLPGRAAGAGLLSGDPLREGPIILDHFIVSDDDDSADYDPTGLDMLDAERSEAPFGSDLLVDVGAEDAPVGELDFEVSQATGASPVESALGGERLNLRGFPTPMRRNGFTQSGFPEVINSERSETISGALTPVTGRAAPGGIRNFLTLRPRGRPARQLRFTATSNDRWFVEAKDAGILRDKKAWHAVTLGARGSRGPQPFAQDAIAYFSGAIAVKHSRSTSSLWQLDWFRYDGNPNPGVVEYRLTPSSRIVGPYRPLVDFHAFGPHAGVRRDVLSLSGQIESQLKPNLSLRAGAQWFGRQIEQDRFTTGQYVVSTGRFSGTREPRHIEQAFNGLMLQSDLTWRFAAWNADHKVLLGVESTLVRGDNEQRALTVADRNALPVTARLFDPDTPDFSRPAYSPSLYERIITDRQDEILFGALVLNSRTALKRGRTVFSLGLRQDFAQVDVHDFRPGAGQPRAEDLTGRLTFHAAANQYLGRYALCFASVSSAFEPSTRVDARTGKIQGNESTFGYETGLRTVLLDRRLSASLTAFQYSNENIARRNPLYDDPIADANQRQPQLVSSGAERFTGGVVVVGWKPSPAWTFTGRGAYTRAITTSSPDVPEEVGRALTRMPATTASGSVRRAWNAGWLQGFSCGLSLVHVGEVIAYYTSDVRERLDYPAYTLLGANLGYTHKRKGQPTWNVRLTGNNVLDRDLVALLARPNSGTEYGVDCSVAF